MDSVKLDDEIWKKSKAELRAQLMEIKAELKKIKDERSLPGAKVTDGAPGKLPMPEELRAFLAELAKKKRAELREAYSNRKPLVLDLRLNSREDPCSTAASPPAFSEDGEGKEAQELLHDKVLSSLNI